MSEIDRLRAWHEAQKGTTEWPPGSNLVRYNEAYYGKAKSAQWCVIYQWNAFHDTGIAELFYGGGKTASCGELKKWAEKHGQWFIDGYKVGDLALFNFDGGKTPKHIGWIDQIDGNYCYCWEGNTSPTNKCNGGQVLRMPRHRRFIVGVVRPLYRDNETAVYSRQNSMDIVTAPADKISLSLVDTFKRSAAPTNYANAGFFANYREDGQFFTLPVAHLVADYKATSVFVDLYTHQRGIRTNGKVRMDSAYYKAGNEQFYRKAISTLIISGDKARVEDVTELPDNADYAISGVPIMRNGKDVTFKKYVVGQGWTEGNVRATKHTFVGLKSSPAATVYIIGMETKKANTILSAEAYKIFKGMGFTDVIKLDGGGSYIFNVNGTPVSSTSENRRINSIILWGDTKEQGNPYPVPTTLLKKGSKGDGVKWLQWALTNAGYDCGGIDGDYGSKTVKAVKEFQKAYGLGVDGIAGPVTRTKLLATC